MRKLCIIGLILNLLYLVLISIFTINDIYNDEFGFSFGEMIFPMILLLLLGIIPFIMFVKDNSGNLDGVISDNLSNVKILKPISPFRKIVFASAIIQLGLGISSLFVLRTIYNQDGISVDIIYTIVSLLAVILLISTALFNILYIRKIRI